MNCLKELRTKNCFSQQYMADNLRISKTFYCQIENKQRRLSYDMAVKIAKVFNLKPDDIFYDEFKK